MRRFRNVLGASRRTDEVGGAFSAAEPIEQDLTPAQNARAFGPRDLLEALDRLSSAVIAATGSPAFFSSERIQLIDAAHKLAWLLVRVHRNEPAVARAPDVAGTTQAVVSATYHLQSVDALGDGVDAIAALFDLIPRIDTLLPVGAQRPQ